MNDARLIGKITDHPALRLIVGVLAVAGALIGIAIEEIRDR
jgi:hypothetical protein